MKNIILLFVAFLVTEFLLQAVCSFSPDVNSMIFKSYAAGPKKLDERVLGRQVGNPDRVDHDENGYRNEKIPDQASLVVLGDSQTYGTNVFREEAWPNLIQRRTGLITYNMALGGYGPAHNLLQFDQALTFSPELVVVAIYFGNDFFDNFKLSLLNKQISEYLNKDELRKIENLEHDSPLAEEAHILFRRGDTTPEVDNTREAEDSAIRKWFSRHSALWGLLREIKNALKKSLAGVGILENDFSKATAAITPEQFNYCSIFESEDWRTILTSPYRDLVNDRSDPRIDSGFDITLRLLPDIRSRVRSSGAQLLIVLIPTKESVFVQRVPEPDLHIGYSSLVSNEENNRKQLIEFMERENIQYIDVLPALQMAKQQPYFENADGHPNPFGHSIIADRVIDWLQEKQGSIGFGRL